MRKFTLSAPATLVWLILATLPFLLAACGAGATSSPTATPTQRDHQAPGNPDTPTTMHTATPTTPFTAGGSTAGWTADLPNGGNAGNLAPDTTVTLADGSTASLASIADGKPLLLYFFATW